MTFVDGNALTAAELNDFDTNSITITDSTNEDKVNINKSGTGIGNVIDIANAGTGTSVQVNTTGSGKQMVLKSGGTSVFEIANNGDVDMKDNDISNVNSLTFDTLSSAPVSPTQGQVYYNTTEKKLYYYTGSVWRYLDGRALGYEDPQLWEDTSGYSDGDTNDTTYWTNATSVSGGTAETKARTPVSTHQDPAPAVSPGIWASATGAPNSAQATATTKNLFTSRTMIFAYFTFEISTARNTSDNATASCQLFFGNTQIAYRRGHYSNPAGGGGAQSDTGFGYAYIFQNSSGNYFVSAGLVGTGNGDWAFGASEVGTLDIDHVLAGSSELKMQVDAGGEGSSFTGSAKMYMVGIWRK